MIRELLINTWWNVCLKPINTLWLECMIKKELYSLGKNENSGNLVALVNVLWEVHLQQPILRYYQTYIFKKWLKIVFMYTQALYLSQ